MNPHYHHPPYPDLNSPHSPSSDGVPSSVYHGHGGSGGGPPNGHIMSSHHDHIMHSHPAFAGGPMSHSGNGSNTLHNYHHHHHQHHHFLNSNNSSNNNNTNSNNQNHMNAICAACNNKILDRYILRVMDRDWHNSCLKCHLCHRNLADVGPSCFTKQDMILCRNDYVKMFGATGACSACGQTIPACELVMRTGGPAVSSSPANVGVHHVFHIQCFICSKCGHRLTPGEKYGLLGGSLVCEHDYNKLKASSMHSGQQQANTPVRKGKVGRPRRSRD